MTPVALFSLLFFSLKTGLLLALKTLKTFENLRRTTFASRLLPSALWLLPTDICRRTFAADAIITLDGSWFADFALFLLRLVCFLLWKLLKTYNFCWATFAERLLPSALWLLLSDFCRRTFADGLLPSNICRRTFAADAIKTLDGSWFADFAMFI